MAFSICVQLFAAVSWGVIQGREQGRDSEAKTLRGEERIQSTQSLCLPVIGK